MRDISQGNFNVLPYIPSICRKSFAFDPVTATIVVGAMTAGATAYSAAKESSAAKKAAEAQAGVARAQLKAAQDKEILAAQAAQDKLKLKQASKTQTILTAPGMQQEADQTNMPSILGV